MRRRLVVAALAVVAMALPMAVSSQTWLDFEMEDVNTGEIFRVSDFAGKPVLLETFAVWCSNCKRQQHELVKLHEEVGDEVVSIALSVDPNESASLVRQHAESNGFHWRYAVSPPELTRALIDQFGTSVVSAPSVPMILISPDQTSAQLLRRGVKRVDRLLDELAMAGL